MTRPFPVVSRNLWYASACLILGLAGCDYSAESLPSSHAVPVGPVTTSDSVATPRIPSDSIDVERRLGIHANVVNLIRKAGLNPGGSHLSQAITNLNLYYEGADPSTFALSGASRDYLRSQSAEAAVREVESPSFSLRDARHLEDCLLYRGIAERVAGRGDDLTRVRRVFDWLTRHVQLVPAGSLAAPGLPQVHARPFDVLMRGMAVEDGGWSERGWVFLALCRQLEVDVGLVTFTPPGQKAPAVWLCGVLVGKTLYLFDMRLGRPVPAPDGKGVATLDDALNDPAVLAGLDLPGERAYPASRAALLASPSKIGIWLDSSPGYFSPRMRLLQGHLEGPDRTVLYRDPAEQRDRFAEVLGRWSGGVSLWDVPKDVETRLFTDPGFVEATQRAQPYFYPRFPLVGARMKQLRGDLTGAVEDYVTFSLRDNPTETDKKTPLSASDQRALDVYASYFLGLCHLERNNPRLAETSFERTLKLIPEARRGSRPASCSATERAPTWPHSARSGATWPALSRTTPGSTRPRSTTATCSPRASSSGASRSNLPPRPGPPLRPLSHRPHELKMDGQPGGRGALLMNSESGKSIRWGLIARRVAPILFLIALAGVCYVLPDFLMTYPRWVRQRSTEWFLRGLLVAYWVMVTLAVPGTLLTVALAWGAWKRRAFRPWMGRAVLVCAATCFGLVMMEAGAACWGAWAHRMPTLPTRFPAAPGDEIDVVVIGESSARGDPFHPLLSIGQIVGWQLERVLPGKRVRVDVLAEPGVTLERMHQKLEGLERRPDVLIIYCGHNEFQARYDWAHDVGHDEAPANAVLDGLFRASLRSPLCRMIYETVNKNRLDEPPRMAKHSLIDPPLCSPSEYARILDDFSRRLEAMVAYCDRIKALAVLVIPPGNEGGYEPNRSSLHGAVSDAEKQAILRQFEAARGAEDDAPRAIALYEKILARYPRLAEAHFRLGRLHEGRGDTGEANRRYAAARDTDSFPQRCPGPFQDAYRAVAARHRCLLIDGPAEFRSVSPNRILNDNLFHDAQHPALFGHITLAQAVLRSMRAREALGWKDGTVPAIDPAECAAHFGLDAKGWSTVCSRAGWFYEVTAKNRFDRTERQAKEQLYKDASLKIADGVAPEESGIPGLGVRPAPVLNPGWALDSHKALAEAAPEASIWNNDKH